MEEVAERLSSHYTNLLNSNLILKKLRTDSDINEFQELINRALPVTTFEKAVSAMVRFQSSKNRNKYVDYLKNAQLEYLCLLGDGGLIVRIFNLYDVSVRWDQTSFKVTLGDHDHDINERVEDKPRSYNEGGRGRGRGYKSKQYSNDESRGRGKYNRKNNEDNYSKNKHTIPEIKTIPPLGDKATLNILKTAVIDTNTTKTIDTVDPVHNVEKKKWGDMEDNE
jgi:hypothetical protein